MSGGIRGTAPGSLTSALRRPVRPIRTPAARAAIESMTYELIPLANIANEKHHLPPGARVSVTASPTKPLEASLDVCAELLARGHHVIPHLAARKVRDACHLRSLARRVTDLEIREIFCIGGDASASGPFPDAMSFLRPFLDLTADAITAVGVAGYPDGHTLIDQPRLAAATAEKQELLEAAGVSGYVATQMCFSPDAIRDWLRAEREAGITLPVHLGVPGVVERAKLLTIGMRLGVGPSLRFLQKNRNSLARLFTSSGYNPGTLVEPLAPDFGPLRIEGLHVFTFNRLEATTDWQRAALG